MKKRSRRSGGSSWELPTEEEVDIAKLLLNELPVLPLKSDLISRYSFTWGVTKKRSVLDSVSESFANKETSPSTPMCFVSSSSSGSDCCDKGKAPMYGPNILKRKATYDLSDSISGSFAQQKKSPTSPRCFVPNGGSSGSDCCDKGKEPMYGPNVLKRKATYDLSDSVSESFAQQKKSPTSSLCFVSSGGSSGSGSGSDGCDKGKAPLYGPNVLKIKETYDFMEVGNRMREEKDTLMMQLKCMETLHEELTYESLEPKSKGKKISYPSNMEDHHIWNNSMKASDQQRCHEQITMMVDPTQVASCSTNSNDGCTFEFFDQIDPRVKAHYVETYDFMGSYQPLDKSRYMVMNNDLKVRAAADARKSRELVLKEKKKTLRIG